MSDIAAVYVPEVDLIRVDLPGAGYRTSVLLQPDQALRLLTALKVALACRPEPNQPTPRPRRGNARA